MKHGFWDWVPYYWRFRHVAPRGTALKALAALEPTATKTQNNQTPAQTLKTSGNQLIVDLGTGQGTDALAFLQAGWHVMAVDVSRASLWITRYRAIRHRLNHKLNCIQSPLEELAFPPCAGVNASFSLPFSAPEVFPDMWPRLVEALPPGGVFAGQFFGLNDTWASTPMVTNPTWHIGQEDLEKLFEKFTILDLKETDQPGKTPKDPKKEKFAKKRLEKHWHVYHIVARKK